MTVSPQLVTALKTAGKLESEEQLVAFINTFRAAHNMTLPQVIQFLHMEATDWLNGYGGGLPFVVSARKHVGQGKTLSDKQLKGVLNCMRVDPTGVGKTFNRAAPPATPDGQPRQRMYATDSVLVVNVSLAKRGYNQRKNGTCVAVVRDAAGRHYIVTKQGSGKWAGYTFIAGGVTAEEVKTINAFHLPKVGMQKPDGTMMLNADCDVQAVRSMLIAEFDAKHPANTKGYKPGTPADDDIVAVIATNEVFAPEEPVEAEPVAAAPKAPKAPKRTEPAPAEPATPAKRTGTSIRDLVRQRNGM